jgi:hypothetical protein
MSIASPEGGISLEVFAGMSASLGQLVAEAAWQREYKRNLIQEIHPFSVPAQGITLTAGAGTLDQPNLLGPRTGRAWDVRRMSVTGFTAGTVTVCQTQANADVLAVFSSAGVLLNGKAQLLVNAGDRMIFVASGITGSVTVSIAGIDISATLLGDYLL